MTFPEKEPWAAEALPGAKKFVPTPEPYGALITSVRVIHKSSIRRERARNARGKPIMCIHPTDKQVDIAQRVQYPAGAIVTVYADVVVADGGGKLYCIVGSGTEDWPLYLRWTDVRKA